MTEVRPVGVLAAAWETLRPFWPLAALGVAAGGITGLATAAVLAFLHGELQDGGSLLRMALFVPALAVVSVAGEFIGGVANGRVGQHVVAALRRDLARRVAAAPLADIEAAEPHRLLSMLDVDVGVLSAFTINLSGMIVSLAVIAGCFGYLAWLSLPLFLVAALGALAGFRLQLAANRAGIEGFAAARAEQDELQYTYRAIIDGAKEIRIGRARRERTMARLEGAVERIRGRLSSTLQLYFGGQACNSTAFFATLGAVLGVGHWLSVDSAALAGFLLVLTYTKGPIDRLVGGVPLVADAMASLRRVAGLGGEIGPAPAVPGPVEGGLFAGNTVALAGATFAFPSVPNQPVPFVLGPIDLSIRRGETVFLVGRNGSGKTTLLKLLLGLYRPSAGELLCDGRPVGAASDADAYRQLFSVIFFDYFLFDDLIFAADGDAEAAAGALRRLEIADKVQLRDDRVIAGGLSTGQRKRLAFVQVLLDRRPFVLLDEWAADQDPAFREVFYRDLLPELKRNGKTLIVVSHDDRYFDVADRVVELEAGRIVADGAPDARTRPVRQRRGDGSGPRDTEAGGIRARPDAFI
ncbi:cyclic peptide export ABC transporter [Prosthecomicrobium sp. N25]|uniref:cyclic peptide export ABC transporter n=1 Tax=Prosthecomicrobium sp. N25 TaxID=3129254 RepID=UPI003077A646